MSGPTLVPYKKGYFPRLGARGALADSATRGTSPVWARAARSPTAPRRSAG